MVWDPELLLPRAYTGSNLEELALGKRGKKRGGIWGGFVEVVAIYVLFHGSHYTNLLITRGELWYHDDPCTYGGVRR
jgi:hypothetical protein